MSHRDNFSRKKHNQCKLLIFQWRTHGKIYLEWWSSSLRKESILSKNRSQPCIIHIALCNTWLNNTSAYYYVYIFSCWLSWKTLVVVSLYVVNKWEIEFSCREFSRWEPQLVVGNCLCSFVRDGYINLKNWCPHIVAWNRFSSDELPVNYIKLHVYHHWTILQGAYCLECRREEDGVKSLSSNFFNHTLDRLILKYASFSWLLKCGLKIC